MKPRDRNNMKSLVIGVTLVSLALIGGVCVTGVRPALPVL
jgi:hypothetical protein